MRKLLQAMVILALAAPASVAALEKKAQGQNGEPMVTKGYDTSGPPATMVPAQSSAVPSPCEGAKADACPSGCVPLSSICVPATQVVPASPKKDAK